jgi:hypothetical protein
VVETPRFNQKRFLNDMETYLSRNGGTAPFARLSLIKNVHRPPKLSQKALLDELCALCNSDPRFKFSTDNPEKILEISLTAVVQVTFRTTFIPYLSDQHLLLPTIFAFIYLE